MYGSHGYYGNFPSNYMRKLSFLNIVFEQTVALVDHVIYIYMRAVQSSSAAPQILVEQPLSPYLHANSLHVSITHFISYFDCYFLSNVLAVRPVSFVTDKKNNQSRVKNGHYLFEHTNFATYSMRRQKQVTGK
jgi:hypothetical protein